MTVTSMPNATAPAAAEETPKKGKKKLIIIILAVVLLLLIGAGAGWFFFLRGSGDEKPPPPVAGLIVPLDPIQVNLADDHYLRVGIALQLVEGVAEADGSKALDATIDMFSGRDIDEVSDPEKRRKLKEDLTKVLEKDYEDEVMGIYFTDFVTQ